MDSITNTLSTSQFVLPEPPKDSISSVKFIPNSNPNNLLAVSSWDGHLRVYDVDERACVFKSKDSHPLLCCTTTPESQILYGGLDCAVYCTDLASQKTTRIGEHMDAVRCLEYSVSSRVIVSASWDASIMLWDERSLQNVGNHPQSNEVFCMDVRDELIVVGTAGKLITAWDLRNMKAAIFERPSNVSAYQSRCIKIFPNKKKYALGTIEGRVSIDFLSPDSTNSPFIYAFKPHVEKPSLIGHPVNAIGIHNPTSYFVTGASDKRVLLWDSEKKRRLHEYSAFPSSIASIDFSADGSKLAIGCSYLHDLTEVPEPLPPNRIYIRNVNYDNTINVSSASQASR